MKIKHIVSLAAVSLALSVAPVTAELSAQERATASADQAIDYYAAMAEAVTSDAVIEATFEQAIEIGFKGAMRADPEMDEIEKECPGTVQAMADAAAPIMKPAHIRDYMEYRADIAALFRANMTTANARSAAEFFNSDIGKNFLMSVSSNVSADATIGAIIDDPDAKIAAEDLESDNRATAVRGIMAMEPLERREALMTIGNSDWGQDFVRLQPQVQALQVEMANSDYSPEENAALEKALEQTAMTVLGKCYLEM